MAFRRAKPVRRSSRTVVARLHKLNGQIVAIDRMLGQKRPCREVLEQIQAVRSGLASVAAIVMNEELGRLSHRRKLDPSDVVKLTQTFIERT